MKKAYLRVIEGLRRCDYFFRRTRFEEQLSEEARFHVEMRSTELQESGLSVAEAEDQARHEFGSVLRMHEGSRDSWEFRHMEELMHDVRYGLRQLQKSPGFAVTAIVSLAIGIGANTAIFLMTEQVLLKTLSVNRPQELRVLSWVSDPGPFVIHNVWGSYDPTPAGGRTSTSFSYPVFLRMRNQQTAFRDLFAFKDGRVTAMVEGHAEPVTAQLVSGNFYRELGVQPVLGRPILPSDDLSSSPPVAVVSYAFWKEHLEKSDQALGKTIRVNDTPVTIVGVNPAPFQGTRTGSLPDVFLPISLQPRVMPHPRAVSLLTSNEEFWVVVLGRLKGGVSESQAQSALSVSFLQALKDTLPKNKNERMPHLKLLRGDRGYDTVRATFAKPIYLLMGIAALILLLACVNLANVLLARAIARKREIAIRAALGAGRMRIVRQVFTESLLLAAGGGLAGGLVGYLVRNLIPTLTHNAWEPSPIQSDFDLGVVGFTVGLSCFTGLLFGAIPAWYASREQLSPGLKEAVQSILGMQRVTLGKTMVSFQVLLSMLLVFSAGLFIRTLLNLRSESLGFEPHHILLFSLDPPRQKYPAARRIQFFHEVEEKLRTVPGVSDLAASSDVLVADDRSTTDFVPDGEATRSGKMHSAWVNSVSGHFFQTMGIPILLGRGFDDRDTATSQPVAVINQRLAEQYFPHVNPIGRTFNRNHIRIVGVSGDTKYSDLRSEPPPTFYRPYVQEDDVWSMTYELKSVASVASLVAAVQNGVSQVDSSVPVIEIRTQTEQIDATLRQERMFAMLTGGFGALALALASIGVYGVMSYTVERRTSEIGLRMALGAGRLQVLSAIMREAVALALVGIAAGILIAVTLARMLGSFLYGLTPDDPLTLLLTGLVLLGMTLVAAWIPGKRASSIDPLRALRND